MAFLAPSFSVWRSSEYLSQFQGHGYGSVQLQNYWSEIAGVDQYICYDNAQSNSELMTFTLRRIHIFWIQASLSVWRYIFTISGLILRSLSQNSGSAQICAPLGHSLIYCMSNDIAVFLR